MKEDLVPGRSCGTCNVCCVGLTIDEPTLRKPQGFRCRNAQPDNSCAIYDSRPPSCRTFYCGWRLLKWVPEPLRPDKSGVLVRMYQPTSNKGPQKPGWVVMPQPTSLVNSDGLCEIIAAGINAGMQIYLDVPGQPGYTSVIVHINKPVARAASAGDKPAILNFLRDALIQAGRVPRSLVILAPEAKAASTESTPSEMASAPEPR
jgi:hypothetical protein